MASWTALRVRAAALAAVEPVGFVRLPARFLAVEEHHLHLSRGLRVCGQHAGQFDDDTGGRAAVIGTDERKASKCLLSRWPPITTGTDLLQSDAWP